MRSKAIKKVDQKMDEIRSAARYNKSFWTLIISMVLAAVCLIHIEASRAKPNELTGTSTITVERIPSSEARTMGIISRNH
jgi:hypothetical protein